MNCGLQNYTTHQFTCFIYYLFQDKFKYPKIIKIQQVHLQNNFYYFSFKLFSIGDSFKFNYQFRPPPPPPTTPSLPHHMTRPLRPSQREIPSQSQRVPIFSPIPTPSPHAAPPVSPTPTFSPSLPPSPPKAISPPLPKASSPILPLSLAPRASGRSSPSFPARFQARGPVD